MRTFYSAKEIEKWGIEATDGKIGGVRDLYFDDQYWTVRYVVVDTGSWLRPGRKTLVSPHSIVEADPEKEVLRLSLSKHSIESGPDVRSDEPVSRKMEERLALHYDWPLYWLPGSLGLVMTPERVATDEGAAKAREELEAARPPGDPDLRSVKEVSGYHVDAKDDDVGKVADFVISGDAWSISYVIVDTGHWLPGRRVLISPRWASEIDWTERSFKVRLTRHQIETSPPYSSVELIDSEYEDRLHDHYGFQKYWKKV